MPVTILSLPSETIYEIGSQVCILVQSREHSSRLTPLKLDQNDNRSLRLVCQYISCSVEALVLSKLFIDINVTFFENTHHQLTSIASQPTRIVKHARDVIIYNSLGQIYHGTSTIVEEDKQFVLLFPVVMSLLSNVHSLS